MVVEFYITSKMTAENGRTECRLWPRHFGRDKAKELNPTHSLSLPLDHSSIFHQEPLPTCTWAGYNSFQLSFQHRLRLHPDTTIHELSSVDFQSLLSSSFSHRVRSLPRVPLFTGPVSPHRITGSQ